MSEDIHPQSLNLSAVRMTDVTDAALSAQADFCQSQVSLEVCLTFVSSVSFQVNTGEVHISYWVCIIVHVFILGTWLVKRHIFPSVFSQCDASRTRLVHLSFFFVLQIREKVDAPSGQFIFCVLCLFAPDGIWMSAPVMKRPQTALQ